MCFGERDGHQKLGQDLLELSGVDEAERGGCEGLAESEDAGGAAGWEKLVE